jgi:hypothetical protein
LRFRHRQEEISFEYLREGKLTANRMMSGGNRWRLKETGGMGIPQSGGQFCPEMEGSLELH